MRVPKGLNPCDVPADVLRDYTLATRQVDFDKPAGASSGQAAEADPATQLAGLMERQLNEGAPTTGRGALAHGDGQGDARQRSAPPARRPSLRYVVGLCNAPGLNIVGAGEPALPGVSIGHNADIAFGITIFAMDQEDLYVYELNP